jgi:hypothetical protein
VKRQKGENFDRELPAVIVENAKEDLKWAHEAAAVTAGIMRMVACIKAVMARFPEITFDFYTAEFDPDKKQLQYDFDFYVPALKDSNAEKYHRNLMVVHSPGYKGFHVVADGDPIMETEEHLLVPCAWYGNLLEELMLEFGKLNATKPPYPVDITGLRRTFNIANGDLPYGDFQR